MSEANDKKATTTFLDMFDKKDLTPEELKFVTKHSKILDDDKLFNAFLEEVDKVKAEKLLKPEIMESKKPSLKTSDNRHIVRKYFKKSQYSRKQVSDIMFEKTGEEGYIHETAKLYIWEEDAPYNWIEKQSSLEVVIDKNKSKSDLDKILQDPKLARGVANFGEDIYLIFPHLTRMMLNHMNDQLFKAGLEPKQVRQFFLNVEKHGDELTDKLFLISAKMLLKYLPDIIEKVV